MTVTVSSLHQNSSVKFAVFSGSVGVLRWQGSDTTMRMNGKLSRLSRLSRFSRINCAAVSEYFALSLLCE